MQTPVFDELVNTAAFLHFDLLTVRKMNHDLAVGDEELTILQLQLYPAGLNRCGPVQLGVSKRENR